MRCPFCECDEVEKNHLEQVNATDGKILGASVCKACGCQFWYLVGFLGTVTYSGDATTGEGVKCRTEIVPPPSGTTLRSGPTRLVY